MYTKIFHLKDYYSSLGEGDCDPKVTVYVQQNMDEMGRGDLKRPAVILCPGGGYRYVSQREAEPVALMLLTAGMNVFVLDYSVAPHTFPTQLREVAGAMELIYANAQQWHVDTNRILIMGFSAGGHLAGHYSNCYDIPEVREVFPESKPVNAAVLCYPVITANPQYCHLPSFQRLSGHEALTREDVEKFSLEKLVSKYTPPTFLWHTFEDTAVPPMNSILYAQSLAELGRPFSIHIYPKGGHRLSTADEQTTGPANPVTMHVADWVDSFKKWFQLTM